MKYLKWVSICLGGLIVLFAIVVGILHLIGQNNLNLAPTVTIATVIVPNDQSSLERGQHLATIRSCSGCHGSK